MPFSRALYLVALLLVPVGCGGQSMATVADMSCTNPSSACDRSHVPSFSATVGPLIQNRCGGCHVAGGEEPSKLLGTYDEDVKQASSALDQVYGCLMPPPTDAVDQLTPDERNTLVQWIVCDTPNN